MSAREIVTPILHLNGTSKARLIEPLTEAYQAVDLAIAALQQAAPNGRDYYPEPGRMERAEAQHQARLQHLSDVYRSLEAEILAIEAMDRRDEA